MESSILVIKPLIEPSSSLRIRLNLCFISVAPDPGITYFVLICYILPILHTIPFNVVNKSFEGSVKRDLKASCPCLRQGFPWKSKSLLNLIIRSKSSINHYILNSLTLRESSERAELRMHRGNLTT